MNLIRTTYFSLQLVKINVIITVLFLFCSISVAAQKLPSKIDTTTSEAVKLDQLSSKINTIAKKELEVSKENYETNQTSQKQNNSFNRINTEIQKANSTLKQGNDYKDFITEINRYVAWKKFAIEGIITNRDRIQTVRNLTSTSILLDELLKRTNNRLDLIKSDTKLLGHIQKRIDSLSIDKELYRVPKDSIAMLNYFQRLTFMSKDIKTLNVSLKNALDSIQKLQIQGDIFKYSLENDIVEIEVERKYISENFQFEKPETLTKKSGLTDRSFINAVKYSFNKGILVLVFYLLNHSTIIYIMIFFIIAIAIYLIVLKQKYIKANRDKELNQGHVFISPLASSTVITMTIFQFFLPLPPFILSAIIWVISTIALITIIQKSVTPYRFKSWMILFSLNILAILDNLILPYTIFESWFIIILSCFGIGLGVHFLKEKRDEIKEKAILIVVILMIVFEIIAVYFMLYARYNLSKAFMTGGFLGILLINLMVWTYRLTIDMAMLSLNLKEKTDEINHELVDHSNHKIPLLFHISFFVGWYVLTNRNTYIFQNLIEPFKNELIKQREFGEFTFTYENIFIFFFVLFLSGFISKTVAFLAKENRFQTTPLKKNSIGSWLVLIRIGIITSGIVIAFILAGIPMGKIAIILGALGVGIGFGLQTLVNNLISGLIIAFEKPVNLHDVVEIGGQTGKMKSIGIRSSVITTWDGADVIIPNGDLLNQHLVNWTLGSSKSRFTIKLGVAYGTDLEKTKLLLMELMKKNQKILYFPHPIVLITEFNNSSIDIDIKFWVSDFNIGLDVKSDLILAIDSLFKEHGIVIPFPQQDIHIKPNDTLLEDGKKSAIENEIDS